MTQCSVVPVRHAAPGSSTRLSASSSRKEHPCNPDSEDDPDRPQCQIADRPAQRTLDSHCRSRSVLIDDPDLFNRVPRQYPTEHQRHDELHPDQRQPIPSGADHRRRDRPQLDPTGDVIRSPAVLGTAQHVLADSGYATVTEVGPLEQRGMEVLGPHRGGRPTLPPDCRPEPVEKPPKEPRADWTRALLRTIGRAENQAYYRLRKQTVEPVLGIVRQAPGFRQFLLRGLEEVAGEWALLMLALQQLPAPAHPEGGLTTSHGRRFGGSPPPHASREAGDGVGKDRCGPADSIATIKAAAVVPQACPTNPAVHTSAPSLRPSRIGC